MPLDNTLSDFLPSGIKIGGFTNFVTNTKPTATATGDRWYKPSDGTEWYWNGSLWLSKEETIIGSDYRESTFSTSGNVWGTAFSGRRLASGRSGIFFNYCTNSYYLTSATTSLSYWTFNFYILYSDNTTELLATHSNASKPVDTWLETSTSVASAKATLSKTCILLFASIAPTGSPPPMYVMTSVSSKWIHP
jgi:hypothetical protein